MKAAFISQYGSGLKMLAGTIEKCPDDLWNKGGYESAYWHIAYHALFYTAFYLSENVEKFTPWEKHRVNYNQLGALDDENKPFIISYVYTKDELLDYVRLITNNLEDDVNKTNEDQESGFYWLPMDKFELHLYNIRHIQHHVGQLIERLHQNGITGINWVR